MFPIYRYFDTLCIRCFRYFDISIRYAYDVFDMSIFRYDIFTIFSLCRHFDTICIQCFRYIESSIQYTVVLRYIRGSTIAFREFSEVPHSRRLFSPPSKTDFGKTIKLNLTPWTVRGVRLSGYFSLTPPPPLHPPSFLSGFARPWTGVCSRWWESRNASRTMPASTWPSEQN